MATQKSKSLKTQAALLDAATVVVRAEGVANLTLDRVAEAAGVSKGGLLYHYPTKQALVAAMLERTLGRADDRLNELAVANDRSTGSFAKAYLDYVRSDQPTELDSATGIFASAALEDGDLAPAQTQFASWQRRLLEDDGLDQTVALLARVVGDGLWLIDLFGLAPPSDEQRGALIDMVEEMIDEPGTQTTEKGIEQASL
ncbi:MAG: AcrR family transcriptional regulator [Verrucomicrobiales bacterium]|jgi:AcrR family transcriptional regulator